MGSAVKQSIQGTAMMTAFSYLMSAAMKDDFREPELLAEMLKRRGVEAPQIAGWLAHFGAGLAWAPILRYINGRMKDNSPVTRSVVMGLVSGVMAVAVWKGFFKMHPRPPRNDRKAYHLQLVIAHWIFSLPFSADRSPSASLPQKLKAEKP